MENKIKPNTDIVIESDTVNPDPPKPGKPVK